MSVVSFWRRDAGVNGISVKIETYWVTKVKICFIKYEDYEEIFSCLPTLTLPSLLMLKDSVPNVELSNIHEPNLAPAIIVKRVLIYE